MWGGWSTPRPGRFTPRRRPGTYCIEGWVGPRAGLDGCRKSQPIGIRSTDRPGRSESLYRQSYPGSQHVIYNSYIFSPEILVLNDVYFCRNWYYLNASQWGSSCTCMPRRHCRSRGAPTLCELCAPVHDPISSERLIRPQRIFVRWMLTAVPPHSLHIFANTTVTSFQTRHQRWHLNAMKMGTAFVNAPTHIHHFQFLN